MVRRLISEDVPWDVLDPALMRALGRADRASDGMVQLAVTVRPADVARLPALALRCRDRDIRLVVQPKLASGRVPLGEDAPAFEALLRQILRDVPATTLLFDLSGTRSFSPVGLSTGSTSPGQREQRALRQKTRGLSTWVRRAGWSVEALASAAQPPLTDHLQGLDGPVQTTTHTTAMRALTKGLINRAVAKDLLFRLAQRSRSVALGRIDAGSLDDVGQSHTETDGYGDVAEFAEDVAIARRAGATQLSVHGLDGMLAAPHLEPWLDAFLSTPAANAPPARTRRATALALASDAIRWAYPTISTLRAKR